MDGGLLLEGGVEGRAFGRVGGGGKRLLKSG